MKRLLYNSHKPEKDIAKRTPSQAIQKFLITNEVGVTHGADTPMKKSITLVADQTKDNFYLSLRKYPRKKLKKFVEIKVL